MRKKYGSFISIRRRDSAVGAKHRVAVAVGQRRDGEVGAAAQGGRMRSTLSLPISFS